MTVVLAIAVLALVSALLYVLLRPKEEAPVAEPDLGPAIQEATAQVASQMMSNLLQANEEARKVDVANAEATLQRRQTEIDKRQQEMKVLADRIAEGQLKIEHEVRKRGEVDLQTRTLLEQMGQTVGHLNSETAGLKKALRQPQTRGQWGEMQLRRCIEIAGMTEHVDFELQETLRTDDGQLRPDARFLLPEGRSFVADSKVPLDAFLDAQEAEDESTRQVHMARHARQAREHIRSLSSKDYQGQFKAGEMPDLVVCFIPNEPALHAAFGADPELFDYALERNVLLVSPTSLIGLLRTMELGWRQERMVAEAAEIADAAGTLHSRFVKFLADLEGVGKGLTTAAKAYDKAVGSMEGRLLPQLRKVESMGVAPGKEIQPPEPTHITVRSIAAPELLEAAEEADPASERDAA
ncbi:MAG TPA: DNA recombination protein RmuC [Solirubrobacterales bacterium]|jgi:DNA recombination protein RmuC|nr:DNA recombination protein RmuC [Solirubrobacterales bacterium]